MNTTPMNVQEGTDELMSKFGENIFPVDYVKLKKMFLTHKIKYFQNFST